MTNIDYETKETNISQNEKILKFGALNEQIHPKNAFEITSKHFVLTIEGPLEPIMPTSAQTITTAIPLRYR